jgi:hypothetical protein
MDTSEIAGGNLPTGRAGGCRPAFPRAQKAIDEPTKFESSRD